MDDKRLNKDEIESTRDERSDDDSSESGGKKKYIHKCRNHKWTGTITCTNFQEPAGPALVTTKVSFWHIQAGDESNDDNESIAESSSQEEMEVDEMSQIGN